WQNSKDSFPELAAIAREYLSILLEKLEDIIDQLKNIEIPIKTLIQLAK
ncbi:36986_t:CDS:1, partial [Gigaspora margarita]